MIKLRMRIGSFLLVFAMLLTLLPVSALAAGENSGVEGVQNRETPSVDVASEVDLTAAVANASGATTIRLTADIPLEEPLVIPEEASIVLDLNGNTLSATKDITDQGVIDNSGTLTVKNGTVAAVDNGANTQGAGVINRSGAVLTVEQDEGQETKLLGRSAIQTSGTVIIYGGTVESYNRNAIWGQAGSSVTIYDGYITAPTGSSGTGRAISSEGIVNIYGGTFYAGGVNGSGDNYVNAIGIFYDGVVTIDPAEGKTVEVTSETDYAVASRFGAKIFIYGGTFSCNGDRTDVHNIDDEFEDVIAIYGGAFRHEPYDAYLAENHIAAQEDGMYHVYELQPSESVTVNSYSQLESALDGNVYEPMDITLGTDIEIPANADLTLKRGYVLRVPAGNTLTVGGILRLDGTLENSGTLTVTEQGFVETPLNISNQGTITGFPAAAGDGVVYISTPMELQWLSCAVEWDNDDIPASIKLTRDIPMPDVEFTPIGADSFYYGSTFDGCGYAISDIQVVVTSQYRGGLFGNVDDVTIQNLTISGTSTNSTSSYIGALAGYMSGNCTIQNVHVEDYTVYSPISYGVGGLVGQIYSSDPASTIHFIGCTTNMDVTGYANTGGIWGTSTGSKGTIGIYNCTLAGNVAAINVNGGVCGGFGNTAPVEIIGLDHSGLKVTVKGAETTILVSAHNATLQDDYADGALYAAVRDDTGNWIPTEVGNIAATTDGIPYLTFAAAIDAAQPGSVVTVQKELSLTDSVSIDLDIRVNGFSYVSVATGGTLTISAGTYDADPTPYLSGAYVSIPNGDGTYAVVPITAENAAVSVQSQSGSTTYCNSLEAAVAAAESGDTILLLRDLHWVKGGTTVLYVDGMTLDLNGFTLFANNFALVFQGSNFTIENGKLNSNGGSYALFVGDEEETSHVVIQDITATGGFVIYNVHDVVIRDVDVTGTDYYAVWCDPNGQAVIESGTFRSNGKAVIALSDTDASLQVKGGMFDSSNGVPLTLKAGVGIGIPVITGGNFTSDPSAYLAEGLVAVESDVEGYNYTVAVKETTAAEVVVAAPDVKEPALPEGISQEAEALAGNMQEAMTSGAAVPSVSREALTAAANGVANENQVTEAEGKAELEAKKVPTEGKDISIVVQPYLDIQITGASSEGQSKSVTVEITPMYRTVATTANLSDPADEIVLDGKVNAVQIGEAEELKVTKPVTVTIPVPSDFAAGDLYIEHHKDSNTTYYYTGTVDSGVLTFQNPKGFSEFVLTTENAAVAEIEGIGYATLQEAVDEVRDGQTIRLLADGQSATVSRTVSFLVDKNGKDCSITAGSRTSMEYDEASGKYTFIHTASSGSTGYAITVEKSSHGSVTASTARASRGTKVTLTVKADEGYVLDSLTVKDASGKAIDLTEADGKYTFTMPASAVTVSATFVDEGLPFTDVTGHWALDAIGYVYEKGMMNGTGATTFSPESELTRGMIVTILHRLEEEPAAGGSDFSDVSAGQYYGKAIAWASANGIVTGYPDGTYRPEDSITREQLAAILYRYAQYKGMEAVTTEENLAGFPDGGEVSSYAVQAMNWAVGQGLLSGTGDGSLRPQGTATRAQVATILMRYCENQEK